MQTELRHKKQMSKDSNQEHHRTYDYQLTEVSYQMSRLELATYGRSLNVSQSSTWTEDTEVSIQCIQFQIVYCKLKIWMKLLKKKKCSLNSVFQYDKFGINLFP